MEKVKIDVIEQLDDGCLEIVLTAVSYAGDKATTSKIVPIGGPAVVLENNIVRDLLNFVTVTLRLIVNSDTHVDWYIGEEKTTICPKEFYLNSGLVY